MSRRSSGSSAFSATARERQPGVSPDGKWVAYTSNATGVDEVYVLPLSRKSAPRAISSGGGAEPLWSADGKELFFRNGNTIWAVGVRTSPMFELTTGIEPLFTGRYDFSSGSNWDLLPDGRFLMVKGEPGVGREIRFTFNWIERLGTGSERDAR